MAEVNQSGISYKMDREIPRRLQTDCHKALGSPDGEGSSDRVRWVDEQLQTEPTVATRNRKSMQPGGPAPWELRVGRLRVFYHVKYDQIDDDDFDGRVVIEAVGVKEGNRLTIGGVEWKS